MNRQQLIDIIASETSQTKRATDQMLSVLINTIQTTVASGEKVSIMGFGSFDAKHTAPRTGRDIHTGEALNIPATTKPKFTPGANFRDAVKNT